MPTGQSFLRKIYYRINSGKKNKLFYYTQNIIRQAVPKSILQRLLKYELAKLEERTDKEYILDRVNYYCKLSEKHEFDRMAFADKSLTLKDLKMNIVRQSVYWFDFMEFGRYFPRRMKAILTSGDVNTYLPLPSITKSRPVSDSNQNSIIMNLNKVRHFIFIHDKTPFADKKNMVIFRGGIVGKRRLVVRQPFVEKFFGNLGFDIGVLDRRFPVWYKSRITIQEHLENKYIMALEGNDVASNLKWVMSSNSIAVMPRPEMETWFMEGRLIPNYHYIEVKSDFSDIEEKLKYYSTHLEEAEAIISHAHEYINQFRDKKREKLISLLVLNKYLTLVNTYSE